MDEQDALQVIKIITGRSIESEISEAKNLVKILGYLPLALAQAGAYIRQNNVTIAEYLNLYKSYEIELLAESLITDGLKNSPVLITWDISLKAIAKAAAAKNEQLIALELLTVCSYLSPDKIPRSLLLAWLKKAHPNLSSPELTLNRHIELLWRYSMINHYDSKNISIHRLVQVVTRHHYRELELCQIDIEQLICVVNEEFGYDWNDGNKNNKNVIQNIRELIVHINSLMEFCVKNNFIGLAELLYKLGSYYMHHSYKQVDAIKILEKGLKILEESNNNLQNNSTLLLKTKIQNHLGYAYQTNEQYDKARELCGKIAESNYAIISPHTAKEFKFEQALAYAILGHVSYNLAEHEGSKDKFLEAEKNYRKSLSLHDEINVWDDQYYRIKNRMGGSVLLQERFDEAIKIFEEISNYWRKSDYKDNIFAARAFVSLAKAYFKKTQTLNNIEGVTQKKIYLEKASQVINEAIKIYDLNYGDYHKHYQLHSVEARELAGDIYLDLKKYKEACSRFNETKNGWKENNKIKKLEECLKKLEQLKCVP